MHVYNDLIEIWNEGTLPEGYDENVLYGKHSSKPRNRNIADTMFKAGFIDTWGRGYKKIRDGFETAGMPMPKVQNFCGGVQVAIERTKFMQMSGVTDNGGNFGGSGGSLAVIQLSERQRRICDTIKNNPKVTVEQMAVALSVAKRTLERELAALQKMGVLVREGNTSAGHWVII
ncbi:MAG: ATP-binding protein [Parabacteroides sp.]